MTRRFHGRRFKRYTPREDESTSDADGVDAIKDAAAEMGISWRDPAAESEARRRGWLGGEPEPHEDD